MARAIFGASFLYGWDIHLNGMKSNPLFRLLYALSKEIAYLSEDGKEQGLLVQLAVEMVRVSYCMFCIKKGRLVRTITREEANKERTYGCF